MLFRHLRWREWPTLTRVKTLREIDELCQRRSIWDVIGFGSTSHRLYPFSILKYLFSINNHNICKIKTNIVMLIIYLGVWHIGFEMMWTPHYFRCTNGILGTFEAGDKTFMIYCQISIRYYVLWYVNVRGDCNTAMCIVFWLIAIFDFNRSSSSSGR
jgi:hypothetical protein